MDQYSPSYHRNDDNTPQSSSRTSTNAFSGRIAKPQVNQINQILSKPWTPQNREFNRSRHERYPSNSSSPFYYENRTQSWLPDTPMTMFRDESAQTPATTLNSSVSDEEKIVKLSALENLYYARPSIRRTSDYAVIKIVNVPWDLTIEDVIELFSPFQIITGHISPTYTECVHILMPRSTSKPASYCYVEFPTLDEALSALDHFSSQKHVFRGKLMRFELSTQKDLFKALFPSYKVRHDISDIHDGCVFISRAETNHLLNACRSLKHRSNSRIAERPFENIISILTKVPWDQPKDISTLQRDHLFEMLKLAVEAIQAASTVKEFTPLLERLLRCGLCVPLFTEKQKLMILASAQMLCPRELLPVVYMPSDQDEASRMDDTIISPIAPGKEPPVTLWDNQVALLLRRQLRDTKEELGRYSQMHLQLVTKFKELESNYESLMKQAQQIQAVKKRPVRLLPEMFEDSHDWLYNDK